MQGMQNVLTLIIFVSGTNEKIQFFEMLHLDSIQFFFLNLFIHLIKKWYIVESHDLIIFTKDLSFHQQSEYILLLLPVLVHCRLP